MNDGADGIARGGWGVRARRRRRRQGTVERSQGQIGDLQRIYIVPVSISSIYINCLVILHCEERLALQPTPFILYGQASLRRGLAQGERW